MDGAGVGERAGSGSEEVVGGGEGGGDGVVHVVVLVAAEAAAEEDVRAFGGGGLVLGEAGEVVGGADGIVEVVAGARGDGVLAVDDGLGGGEGGVFGGEVLELVGAGVGDGAVAFVDDAGALEVLDGEDRLLEADAAPGEGAEAVVEEAVDGAGVDEEVVGGEVVAEGEEVVGEADLEVGVAEDGLDEGAVAVDGDALVGVVVVGDGIGVADGEAGDDEGGELGGVASPLLFGVLLDEGFVEGAADGGEGLFLEVGGFAGEMFACGLGGDPGAGLVGGEGLAEEEVDGGEAEGEGIDAAVALGPDGVAVVVEVGEGADVVPDAAVGGVEDVGAVDVLLDAGLGVAAGVAVAGDVVALLEEEDVAAGLGEAARDDGAVQAGPYHQNVVELLHAGILLRSGAAGRRERARLGPDSVWRPF